MVDHELSAALATENDQDFPEPPVIVTLGWSCGLAIGGPRWIGTDAYECPECDGCGEVAGPFDELDIEEDGSLSCVGWTVYCTACGQELEDTFHFDGVDKAITKHKHVTEARERRALTGRFLALKHKDFTASFEAKMMGLDQLRAEVRRLETRVADENVALEDE